MWKSRHRLYSHGFEQSWQCLCMVKELTFSGQATEIASYGMGHCSKDHLQFSHLVKMVLSGPDICSEIKPLDLCCLGPRL